MKTLSQEKAKRLLENRSCIPDQIKNACPKANLHYSISIKLIGSTGGSQASKQSSVILKLIDFLTGKEGSEYCVFKSEADNKAKAEKLVQSLDSAIKTAPHGRKSDISIEKQKRDFLSCLKAGEGEIANLVEQSIPKEEQLNIFLNIMVRRYYLLMVMEKESILRKNDTDQVNGVLTECNIKEVAYLKRMQEFWATAFLGKLYYENDIQHVVSSSSQNEYVATVENADKYGEFNKDYGLNLSGGGSYQIFFQEEHVKAIQQIIKLGTGIDVVKKVELAASDRYNSNAMTMLQMLKNFQFWDAAKALYNCTIGNIISYITKAVSSYLKSSDTIVTEVPENVQKVAEQKLAQNANNRT